MPSSVTYGFINWNHLTKEENYRLEGYVPGNGLGKGKHSGVTIATGVDLGSKTKDELILSGIGRNSPLMSKLEPFLWDGIKGNKPVGLKAVKLLNAYIKEHGKKPSIMSQEAQTLDSGTLKRLMSLFHIHSRCNYHCFKQFPETVQTLIASLAWHWGPGFPISSAAYQKNTWIALQRCDWSDARKWMLKDPDHKERRLREANDLLPPMESLLIQGQYNFFQPLVESMADPVQVIKKLTHPTVHNAREDFMLANSGILLGVDITKYFPWPTDAGINVLWSGNKEDKIILFEDGEIETYTYEESLRSSFLPRPNFNKL